MNNPQKKEVPTKIHTRIKPANANDYTLGLRWFMCKYFEYEKSIFLQEIEYVHWHKHISTKAHKIRMQSNNNRKACTDLRIYLYLEAVAERKRHIYTNDNDSMQISPRKQTMNSWTPKETMNFFKKILKATVEAKKLKEWRQKKSYMEFTSSYRWTSSHENWFG